MGKSQTDIEIQSEYLSIMGNELGELFHHLRNKCIWLHMVWDEYVSLYGSDSKRIDLINRSAPYFFRIVQDALWDWVLLGLCKLSDPEKSRGKENLTLRALPKHLTEGLKIKTEALLVTLGEQCKFARDWRVRKIAHFDYNLALSKNEVPLSAASRKHVNDALVTVRNILNTVEQSLMGCTTEYEHSIGGRGNATRLLYIIRDGLVAEDARQARLRAGNYLSEDIASIEPI